MATSTSKHGKSHYFLHNIYGVSTWFLYITASSPVLSVGEIEPELRAIVNPYLLGVHLEIPTEDLDLFKANHPNNVTHQRTDVINYWLQNSEDISWDALARAVARMGRHGNLVSRLRKLAKGVPVPPAASQPSERGIKVNLWLFTCILIYYMLQYFF